MKPNNKKKVVLSLNKMRIAQIGNAAVVRGGDGTIIGCLPPEDTEFCTGSINNTNCQSNQTLGDEPIIIQNVLSLDIDCLSI